MINRFYFCVLLASGFMAAVLAGTSTSWAELYINEIYFDPPSGGDSSQEYIELRGAPGTSLDNHYLIFLENEDTSLHTGAPGEIDFMFDLNGRSVGSNGYLTLRQNGSPYANVASGATNLVNTGPAASWGTAPANNSLGVSSTSGIIENSGFTAMLIRNDTGSAPTLGLNLDSVVDNDNDPATTHDGLDFPTGQPGWSVLDSIGFFSEVHEAVFGRTYAAINFGPEIDGETVDYIESSTLQHVGPLTFHPNLVEGQTYVGLGFEIEYIGRYGDSTGNTAKDWHLSNLTNNSQSGFVGAADGFRQSGGDPHGFPRPDGDEVESNQFVPYGTNLNNTIGTANYPLNQATLPWDYNHDGVVDAADYTIWRDTLGQADPTPGTNPLAANADRDGSVDATDFAAWKYHFGESLLPPVVAGGSSSAVPEPASCLLAAAGVAVLSVGRRGRRRSNRETIEK